MNSIVDRLEGLQAEFAAVLDEAFDDEVVAGLPDAEIMRLLEVTGRLQRGVEAVQIEATVQVRERSEGLRGERMTTTYGCAKPADLLERVLRVDRRSAARLVKAAGFTARTRGISDAEFLPARFEQLRVALNEGVLGVDGLLAATAPVEASRQRLVPEVIVEADRQLADFARGAAEAESDAIGASPSPTPAELAVFGQVLAAYLDPDGAEPSDDLASRERGLWFGRLRAGRIPLRGELLPDVAAQLSRLLDSLLNPRVGPVPVPDGVHFTDTHPDTRPDEAGHGCRDDGRGDCGCGHDGCCGDDGCDGDRPGGLVSLDDRSPAQKRHDAFATVLGAAARGGELPDLGGAAPTLVVTVNASDYATGTGAATVDGPDGDSSRVPVRVAAQTGCAGGIQRVLFDAHGRIASLGTSGRVFNALQRRAIIARDGGTCLIPGCTIPATWCEIHHVREHADGGPTHTDNGVALCWHHHRTLHLSEWQIRMRHGIPEIRGPAWWDRQHQWHPTGRRRTRVASRPAAGYG